jgi:tetratricopeptide (TPR) repeat protein
MAATVVTSVDAYHSAMDAAATAESLIAAAEDAREAIRRGQNAAGVEAFEARYARMRETLDWLIDGGRADEAFRLSAALTQFWMASKRVDEGVAWLEGALGTGQGSDAGRARALHDLGYLRFFSGRYDLADRSFAESRALAQRAGDRGLVALALAGSARVQLNDDPAAAVGLLREAMAITDDLPDSPGRSSAQHVLGVALQLSGDLEGARDVMAERLRHARESGNDFVVFIESANLSMVERKLNHLDAAETLSLEALRIVTHKNDQMAIPWVINGLAAATAAKGGYQRAATLLAIAESLLARAGGEWPADEREQHEGTQAAVSAALPPHELERARTAAAAMTLDQAVAVALANA